MRWLLPVVMTAMFIAQPADRIRAATPLANYSPGDFVGVCYVKPRSLSEAPLLQSIGFSAEATPPVSLTRLADLGVEELAVFVVPAAETSNGLQWCLAARLSKSVAPEDVIKKWAQSRDPSQVSVADIQRLEIGDLQVTRCPAGTFFNAHRKYGTLRFLGRDGEPAEEGINVGEPYAWRGYIEGATRSRMIYRFRVTADDLEDGHLPIELRLNAFRTYHSPSNVIRGQVILRNPNKAMSSAPLYIGVTSHTNKLVRLPKRLSSGSEADRQVDLLNDLASGGELDVEVACLDRAMYLGGSVEDVSIWRPAFEYMTVSGNTVLIAQSSELLTEMASRNDQLMGMALKLNKSTGDAVVLLDARSPSKRRVIKQLARLFPSSKAGQLLEGLQTLTLRVDTQSEASQFARLEVAFDKDLHAARLRAQADKGIRQLRGFSEHHARQFVELIDAHGTLASIVFNGAPLTFPRHKQPAAVQEAADTLIAETFERVATSVDGDTFSLTMKRPPLATLKTAWGRRLLCWMEERLARTHFAMDRMDLGVEALTRASLLAPGEPSIWFRRAHQLAYNVAVEFDQRRQRYLWVRDGPLALLEGLEHGQADRSDLLWMTGKVVGDKVGLAEERNDYQRLFATDQQLHNRLKPYVELGRASSKRFEGVDNWLVAKQLYQQAFKLRTQRSQVPEILVAAGPVWAELQLAVAYSEAGDSAHAIPQWKIATNSLRELGKVELTYRDVKLRLGDLATGEKRTTQRGRLLRMARDRVEYDYWLARAELESMATILAAREAAASGRQALADKPEKALAEFERAMSLLEQEAGKEPVSFEIIANSFLEILKSYRTVSRQLGHDPSGKFKLATQLIEAAPQRLLYPIYLGPEQDAVK